MNAIGRDDADDAPERERQPPRPLVEAEELEAERHRRERELGSAEIVQVRKGVVGADERETVGMEEVQREAAREIGDVELVRIPEPALRERRQHEEKERREDRSDGEADSRGEIARLLDALGRRLSLLLGLLLGLRFDLLLLGLFRLCGVDLVLFRFLGHRLGGP